MKQSIAVVIYSILSSLIIFLYGEEMQNYDYRGGGLYIVALFTELAMMFQIATMFIASFDGCATEIQSIINGHSNMLKTIIVTAVLILTRVPYYILCVYYCGVIKWTGFLVLIIEFVGSLVVYNRFYLTI